MNNSRILKPVRFFLLIILLSSMFLVVSPTRRAFAGAINVGTNIDEFTQNGLCSLREAITAANTDAAVDACPAGNGTDTIYLPPGDIFTDLAGTGEDLNMTGDYDIHSNIIFKGAGIGITIIDGASLDRVFQIFAGWSAQFENVTIARGDPGFGFAGGNIHVYGGDLTLINSQVRISYSGSGVYATENSTVTVIASHIEINSGPGLDLQQGATTIIRNSTINENYNSLYSGGGIYNSGILTITNSTISGNKSFGDGGGIENTGIAYLYNVTITNNKADFDDNNVGDGGGVRVTSAGMLTVRNSIIAGNIDGSDPNYTKPDCFGSLTSEGYNLIQNLTGCTITGDTTGNITNLDPVLGVLQDNGGPTFTHALLAGSPAIDAGNPAGCAEENNAVLYTDQRGYVRTGRCDMGAYEYNSVGTPTPTQFNVYLPLILNNVADPVVATSTPTATGTVVNLTPTPTSTRTPTPTATPPQNSTPQGLTPTPIEGYGYINIVDYEFQPALITIHAGRIVTWENFGVSDHSVTSDTGVFDSGTIAPSGKFQYTFTTVGSYPYHCSFHPGMTGLVIVVP